MKIGDHFPYCVTVVDVDAPGRPCLYSNKKFFENTGYTSDEVLGENLRLLQGKLTSQATVEFIRECFKNYSACIQDIVNYKKDGTPFLNRLLMLPIQGQDKKYYIGFQHDITHRNGLEHNNESLAKVNDAEIKHVMNNALSIILGGHLLGRSEENLAQVLTRAFDRINKFVLEVESVSEFEKFDYLLGDIS
jgi:PAS domain S-box-containing protein